MSKGTAIHRVFDRAREMQQTTIPAKADSAPTEKPGQRGATSPRRMMRE